MATHFMFSSESTTEGHPDKLCDQISDAVVDSYLYRDRFASVSVECAIATGIVFLAAKIRSSAIVDIPRVVRDTISEAGYRRAGFDVENCTVMTSISQDNESGDCVDERTLDPDQRDRLRSRNISTAFGYACDHTPLMLPSPIWLAHKFSRRLSQVRTDGTLPYLAPDGKCQVAVEFENRRPTRVHAISVIASQTHADEPLADRLREDVMQHVIRAVLEDEPIQADCDSGTFINPGGPVVVGGPAIHSGMTGRKTASDMYGEYARSSDSALSGKDPARIDRVANYAARYAAKNVVAAGLARECEIQLSYTIGLARPVGIQVETYDTEQIPESEIAARLSRTFDFRLASIMRQFGLRELPRTHGGVYYRRLAVFGQVGREDLDLPWERLDMVDALRA